MKTKLKIIGFLLCLSMLAGLLTGLLSGCGGEKEEAAPVETVAETTQAPGFSIADTVWMVEGIPYTFQTDGVVKAQVEPGKFLIGSYQWDGAAGSVTIQDVTLGLMLDNGTLLLQGEDGFYYSMEPTTADAQPEPAAIPLPTAEDPLDCVAVMAGTDIQIPYPASLKVCGEDDRILQLDAVSEEEGVNNILITLVEIGSGYDWQFRSGLAQAEKGLAQICDQWMKNVYGDAYLEQIDAWAMDGGSYYSYRCYCWLSGEIYSGDVNEPVRALVEFRYYGPTGYIMVVSSSSAADRIDTYEEIGKNILNAIAYGGDWSTEPVYTGGSSSGRGDYIEDDGWGDYIEDDGWGDYIEEEGMGDIFY